MIIAGIDYSYTCPAICICDTSKITSTESIKDFKNFQFYATYEDSRKIKDPNGTLGDQKNVFVDFLSGNYQSVEERFRNIKEWAARVLSDAKVEEVVFEGFAMGSRVGMIFQIAENASVLKQWLNWKNIAFTTPAPTAVKKNFTGKGTANKIQMTDVFNKHFLLDFGGDVFGKSESMLKSKKKDKQAPVEPPRPVGDMVDAYANLVMHPLLQPLYEATKI